MRALAVLVLTLTAHAVSAAPAPAPPPPADDYAKLGILERKEVDAVLAGLHRTVARDPAGKVVREVKIATRPVFSGTDGFLRAFNVLHVTTREAIIRRELLLAAGDRWNQALVDETLRNLRDPLFHNVLVIVPLATDSPDQVDALVVVRDVWSLRFTLRYELQDVRLINLLVQVSENNLFGWRKRALFSLTMDLGTIDVGPSVYDPNIGGTHLTLQALASVIFARDDGSLDGTRSDVQLAYPFWSLRQRWAALLKVSHYNGFQRSYEGKALRAYDAPETEAMEAVPYKYERHELATQAEVMRSFGGRVLQRVGLGHELSLARPRLVEDFSPDPIVREAFTRDVLPRSELASGLYARWQLITPEFVAYRDLDTFDFREDYQLGPTLDLRVTADRRELGSDDNFLGLAAGATYAFGWGGGLFKVGASSAARLQDGELIDRKSNLSAFAASPIVGRGLRLLAGVNLDWLARETNNRFFTLGGESGLRGYPVGRFAGLARVLAHVEVRTRPLRAGFLRFGAIFFWDGGDAAPSVGQLDLNASVGVGTRIVVPQLDQIVIRVDWAFAMNGDAAGWPGTLSVGAMQVF